MMLTLYIGNKNYSSWSMRPWLAMKQSGGPMLFGEFGIADAFYAPVCTRIRTYGLPVPEAAAAYIERVYALPAMKSWVDDALAEQDFVAFDEPYRKQR